MICCYLEQIIIHLLRASTMSQGQVVRSGQLQEAIQTYLVEQVSAYITEHIQERLTVEQIAEAAPEGTRGELEVNPVNMI